MEYNSIKENWSKVELHLNYVETFPKRPSS